MIGTHKHGGRPSTVWIAFCGTSTDPAPPPGSRIEAVTGSPTRHCPERLSMTAITVARRVASSSIGDTKSTRATDLRSPERSEEHTSELQSLMRISYAVFCLKTNKNNKQ